MSTSYQHVYWFIINLIPTKKLDNNMSCYSTEDPNGHKTPEMCCWVEANALKKVICLRVSRLILRGLAPTSLFSPETFTYNAFISQKQPTFLFVS